MRVVHLISQDSGGAGRACVRLHQALLAQGVDSIILTANKTTDLPSIHRLAKNKFQKLIEKIRPHLAQLPLLLYPKRHNDIFSPNLPLFVPRNRLLLRTLNHLKPDIVHLHWIENGFMNIKDLASIHTPMVWSLHDANPYTGGCHYVAAACVRVGIRCKKCPLLHSHFPFDVSFWTFKQKQKTYDKINNLTINGLSKWIATCAKESALFKNKPIINLPNPIDTEIFRPIDKQIARDLLKLTQKKHTIAFGAIGATSLKRKGYDELKTAIESLPNHIKEKCELIVFGASSGDEICGIETHFVGHISDDIALILLYSAASVMIVPSHLESFGQTASESLACGTPVVAFDTSGLKDIITHKYNGYLAKCYDSKDLSAGIEWILGLDSIAYNKLSANARASIVEKFDSHKIAPKYIQAYKNLMRGGVARNLARSLLHSLYISANPTKYIGFGAIGGSTTPRKGYNELKTAIESLPNHIKETCELIVFGASNAEHISGIKTHFLGHLSDDFTLNLAYNACDIFVVPSLAENLSNTIMEALSCAVPVVAFDIGGNSDMITHKINGYLAKANDCIDLSAGIEWILGLDSAIYNNLSANARASVIEKFSFEKVAKSYISKYMRLLNGGGGITNTIE